MQKWKELKGHNYTERDNINVIKKTSSEKFMSSSGRHAQMSLRNRCVPSAILLAFATKPNLLSVMSFSHLCIGFPLPLFLLPFLVLSKTQEERDCVTAIYNGQSCQGQVTAKRIERRMGRKQTPYQCIRHRGRVSDNDAFKILHKRYSASFMFANAVVDSHSACVIKVFQFYEHVISFHECNRAE